MADALPRRLDLDLARARAGSSMLGPRTRHRLVGYALVAPAALLVFGMLIYPLFYDLWLSLTDATDFQGPGDFVGFGNYAKLVADPATWQAAGLTVLLIAGTVAVEFVAGVLTAMLLWWRFWGRPVVFVAVFVPWAFPAAFSAFAWYWLLSPPFHAFYTLDVLAGRWWLEGLLGMGAWHVLSIAVMNVWRGSSIIAVFLLAAFNAIPEELLDFGKLEVRNAWQYVWRVVVPLARRFFVLGALVAVVITYTEYVSMYLETGGRITVPVLGTLAYREAILNGNTGLGAALALIQVPFAIALALLCLGLVEPRAAAHRTAVSSDRAPDPTRDFWPLRIVLAARRRPGPAVNAAGARARPPARRGWPIRRRVKAGLGFAAAGAVAIFHVFPLYYTAVQAVRSVPEYALGNPFWVYDPTFEDIEEVLENDTFWRWSLNTLLVFGLVLVVGLTVSLLASYALARFDLPGARWVARLMFLAYFVPQSAVIVPVYQVFLLWHLDDTILAIVLLYLGLAIPFATWLLYMHLLGLSRDTEEHALCEANRLQVFLRIVLPMSWPVVIAAGLFAIGMMGSDVLYAGTFSFSNATKTLPAGLGLIAVSLDEWAPVNAAILLGSLPIVVACAALSRYYVRGLRAALIEGA
ncbi:MAG TPA: ABC transporter permease subunit [Chloroflexota bacterium]|nr:ABC transporter permease subunit [Chloroflexota bacterium]